MLFPAIWPMYQPAGTKLNKLKNNDVILNSCSKVMVNNILEHGSYRLESKKYILFDHTLKNDKKEIERVYSLFFYLQKNLG